MTITMAQVGEEAARIDRAIEGLTLVDVLDRNALEHTESPAIHWKAGETWKSMTWKQYQEVVKEVAAGLIDLGIAEGDVVAIQAGNRPEHVIADLAAIHARAAGVTLYGTLAPLQMVHILNDCQAKIGVVEDAARLGIWEQVWPETPALEHLILMSGGPATNPRVTTWDALLERGRAALGGSPDLVSYRASRVAPEDVATMIYTSGTTGLPKGVVFTHRNLLWTMESVRRGINLPDRLRLVSYLPLAHIAERMSTHYLGAWLAGQVYYCPELSEVVDYVREAHPQAFLGVPRVWEKLQVRLLDRFADDRRQGLILRAISVGRSLIKARQRGRRPRGASMLNWLFDRLIFRKIRRGLGMDQLQIAVVTAAPCDPELIGFFNALGIPLCELYGLSECSGPATTNTPTRNRIGTAGFALPGVEIAIATDNEILIRGGNVAAGYHNLPRDTVEAFDSSGWLHTGDLGSLDSEGFLTVVGRKKDIIITASGKNIAPAPIETSLKRYPLIAHVCLVGDERPYLTALIAIDPEAVAGWARSQGLPDMGIGELSRLSELRSAIQTEVDRVNEGLARAEQIKKFLMVPEEWTPETGEVTPSLKVKRAVVLAKYGDSIKEMYHPLPGAGDP